MDKALKTTETFNWWAQHRPLVNWVENRQHSGLERRINCVHSLKKKPKKLKKTQCILKRWQIEKKISKYLYNKDFGQGHGNKNSCLYFYREKHPQVFTQNCNHLHMYEKKHWGANPESGNGYVKIQMKHSKGLHNSENLDGYNSAKVLTYYFQVCSYLFQCCPLLSSSLYLSFSP